MAWRVGSPDFEERLTGRGRIRGFLCAAVHFLQVLVVRAVARRS